jgi:hypothetical protein
MPALKTEPGSEAAIVVIERPQGADVALRTLPGHTEQTHVLAKFSDEGVSAFSRRVLRRVRQVRHAGLKIRGLSYTISNGPERTRPGHQGRLLSSLIRSLEPGATFTLIACGMSVADAMNWTDALLTAARVGVSLEVLL